MVTIVRLPKFGETMKDALIGKWYKKEGDRVNKGEPLVGVETEKFTVDVEAPDSGILRRIIVAENSVAVVGEPLCIIAEENEELPDIEAIKPSMGVRSKEEKPSKMVKRKEYVKISPRARKLAEEYGIDITSVTGSGPNGRIIEKDVLMVLEQRKAKVSVKKEAEIIPLTGMRKTIAERLSYSARTTVPVTITTEVDVSKLKQFREKLTSDIGVHISFTDLLVKAVAEALKRYPILNSTFEADHIKIWKNINIGIAVAVKDGLVVPVIYDADKKSIKQIATYSKDIIDKARRGKITPDETTGSTFTITNLGMYGIDIFTPIINPPESAILGVGKISEKPVVVDGQIAVRHVMSLSLTFDHRVVDGAVAAQFLQEIKHKLENPFSLIETNEAVNKEFHNKSSEKNGYY